MSEPDAVEKLATLLYGYHENCNKVFTDVLVKAIRAAIREEMLTAKYLVLQAEEIVELEQRVEKLEKFLVGEVEKDCTPDESEDEL